MASQTDMDSYAIETAIAQAALYARDAARAAAWTARRAGIARDAPAVADAYDHARTASRIARDIEGRHGMTRAGFSPDPRWLTAAALADAIDTIGLASRAATVAADAAAGRGPGWTRESRATAADRHAIARSAGGVDTPDLVG